ncbi:hypothetical protein B0H13DRAFT_1907394 [Mycena leptocephala]|nr:hypothetical protein B0H13DRAFT_1907394 [Mycena leptocephala]
MARGWTHTIRTLRVRQQAARTPLVLLLLLRNKIQIQIRRGRGHGRSVTLAFPPTLDRARRTHRTPPATSREGGAHRGGWAAVFRFQQLQRPAQGEEVGWREKGRRQVGAKDEGMREGGYYRANERLDEDALRPPALPAGPLDCWTAERGEQGADTEKRREECKRCTHPWTWAGGRDGDEEMPGGKGRNAAASTDTGGAGADTAGVHVVGVGARVVGASRTSVAPKMEDGKGGGSAASVDVRRVYEDLVEDVVEVLGTRERGKGGWGGSREQEGKTARKWARAGVDIRVMGRPILSRPSSLPQAVLPTKMTRIWRKE